MNRVLSVVVGCFVLCSPGAYVGAHCEVPCGIYDDARRFAELREDAETISKAVAGIVDLSNSMSNGAEPLAINQATRWVVTKESHATNIQHLISQYFMTQRIKAEDPKYVPKLTAAHGVLLAAMKCKQTADKTSAEALRKAVDAFEKAYGG